MTDGIIKGTGNSRFLKGPANAAALYPDFESFRDAWAAGTLPIDLNGINPAGWEVVGDKLEKSTLLTDALCTALGLPTTATPTQAMEKLRQLTATAQTTANWKAQIVYGSYTGSGGHGSGSKNTLTFSSPPYLLFATDTIDTYTFYAVRGSYGSSIPGPSGAIANSMIWSGNTVSWYNRDSTFLQLNANLREYYYIALL